MKCSIKLKHLNWKTATPWYRLDQTMGLRLPKLPREEIPIPRLNKKWRKKLPNLLNAWGGVMPPPLISHDPEVFSAQQRIFGYRTPSPSKTNRKKDERYFRRAEAMSDYYPDELTVLKRRMINDLRHIQKRAKERNDSEEEEIATEMIKLYRLSQSQIDRKGKLLSMARRGRSRPKKGEGKRSIKK